MRVLTDSELRLRRNPPTYGFICVWCGQSWDYDAGKHTDPAHGGKCRDSTGGSSSPVRMGPCATQPWGPDHAIEDATFGDGPMGYAMDYGYARRLVERLAAIAPTEAGW